MKRPHGSRSLAAAGALLAALALSAASADGASAAFNVNITLNDPLAASQGVCIISETLSAQTNAVVQVVCSSGQFVRIEPDPGKPFLGTHGGAFRYHFPSYGVGPPENGDDELRYIGAGTVTAMRVYNPGSKTSLLELLVSF